MSHTVYAVLGASYLWPWNAFITVSALARDKLSETPALYANYSSAVMTISTLTGLLLNMYLAYRAMNYSQRVVQGEVITALSFCGLATIGELVRGKAWFLTVIAAVFLSGVGTSLIQNGTMAITQRIPGGTHALAVMNGQAVAGVVPPLLVMLVSGTAANAVALLSFLSVSALCGAAVLLFKSKANQEYVRLTEEETHEEDLPDLGQLWKLLQHLWVPCSVIVLAFIVSLCYPLFANIVESRSVRQALFSPLTHLVWNTGDLLGRVICQAARFRAQRPKTLLGLSLARFAIVAVLIVLARSNNPSDVLYLAIMLGYGMSGGHLVSSAIAYAPSCAPPHLQPASGGLLGLVISVGLLLGSCVSFAVVPLL